MEVGNREGRGLGAPTSFRIKLLSIISHYHPSVIDVLSTCLLPHGCNMAATAPNVVPSLNYPKREGRKGWMESGHSFIQEGKAPFSRLFLTFLWLKLGHIITWLQSYMGYMANKKMNCYKPVLISWGWGRFSPQTYQGPAGRKGGWIDVGVCCWHTAPQKGQTGLLTSCPPRELQLWPSSEEKSPGAGLREGQGSIKVFREAEGSQTECKSLNPIHQMGTIPSL